VCVRWRKSLPQFPSSRRPAASLEWHLSAIIQTFLRTDGNSGNKTLPLLRFLQNGSLPTHVEFVASLGWFNTSNFLDGGEKMRHPSPRELFQSKLSLQNSVHRRHDR
jgi:hypothetical protein